MIIYYPQLLSIIPTYKKNPYKTDGISKNALLRDVSHTAAAPVRTVHDPSSESEEPVF